MWNLVRFIRATPAGKAMKVRTTGKSRPMRMMISPRPLEPSIQRWRVRAGNQVATVGLDGAPPSALRADPIGELAPEVAAKRTGDRGD